MADISYNKTTWVNGSTALNAANLNNIEIGVDNATKAVNNKVDKVAGKGLSTHDFDDHYKNVIDNLQGEGGISVIELTNKNGTIASTQLGEINANPQNFAFKYNGKILLFTSADSTTYQYCNNTTSSSDNNVMTTSTRLTITSSTGAYTIAENVHNVAANSIHPVNGGDLTNIQVGSKVYSIPSGGGGIPVIEGTLNEQESTESTKYYTIPETQTSPFIFHASDIGYVFIDVLDERYSGIVSYYSDSWDLFSGGGTTLSCSLYIPASFYGIEFSGNFPTDENSSVDVPFSFYDRFTYSMCLVRDIDTSKVFLKDGNDMSGSFQTPITYCDDGKYRYWSMVVKEEDTVTIKCKVLNLDGGGVSVTFEN